MSADSDIVSDDIISKMGTNDKTPDFLNEIRRFVLTCKSFY